MRIFAASRVQLAVLMLGILSLGLTSAECGERPATTSAPAGAPGLSVDANGTLLKEGRAYRGIGVNCFDLFYRTILKADDASYKDALAALAKHKVPFARFAACGFWPKDFTLYRTDKAEHFRRLDAVVKEAEKVGVGLIPSLFWYHGAVPDLVGEPQDQWGNPRSKTHEFLRTYTAEVVRRYKDSPAIWAWEFGNEYNLPADLPNREKFRPRVNPALGTAATRTARDDLTGAMIVTAFEEFAKEVRRHDPRRAILSGNSAPRPYAWHNATENSWTLDTPEQFARMLLRDNPSPVNTLTIHVYPAAPKAPAAGQTPDANAPAGAALDHIEQIVQNSMAAARQARKPLFVGEFGADQAVWKGREKAIFERLFRILEEERVPLSAVWVFDLAQQEGTHNITPTNDRAYILRLLEEANARLSRQDRPKE